MRVALVLESEVAEAAKGCLAGDVVRLDGDDLRAEVSDVGAEELGPKRIVEFVQKQRARVVVLDVLVGGSRFLAMNAVRELLRKRKPPAIVLLSVKQTPKQALDAWWKLGVFAPVNRDGATDRLARHLADEAILAEDWLTGNGPRRPFASSPALLAVAPRPRRSAPRAKSQPRKKTTPST